MKYINRLILENNNITIGYVYDLIDSNKCKYNYVDKDHSLDKFFRNLDYHKSFNKDIKFDEFIIYIFNDGNSDNLIYVKNTSNSNSFVFFIYGDSYSFSYIPKYKCLTVYTEDDAGFWVYDLSIMEYINSKESFFMI